MQQPSYADVLQKVQDLKHLEYKQKVRAERGEALLIELLFATEPDMAPSDELITNVREHLMKYCPGGLKK